jgi:hypothetical protein
METRFIAALSQVTMPPTANDKSVAKPETPDRLSDRLQLMETRIIAILSERLELGYARLIAALREAV